MYIKKKMLALLVLAILLAGLLIVNFTVGEKKVETDIQHLYGIQEPQFLRSMGLLTGPSILDGNRATELINGDAIFPAMLEAIHGAKRTILFETYIYWSGEIGDKFAEALAERARAGVKVHVLVDWVGSVKMDGALVDRMKKAGVEVEKYHPVRWYNLGRLNNRTHRKLLIVDGSIGFTGGVGIAENWTGHGQDPDHWRDSHFRIEGPVVAQMQSVMLDNWVKTKGTVLHGPEYFPALKPVGPEKAQMFSSSPSGGSESMLMMYLLAITAAKKSIDLSSAYFVPDGITRRALASAVKRGVKVRIILPGFAGAVGRAARSGRRDPRIPAHHVPLQGDDRRRLHDVGGLDQLRRAFVPPERRGQPEHLRPRVRGAPDEGVRGRPEAVEAHHARTVARAPVDREAP
jgi:cardiolipin synthase